MNPLFVELSDLESTSIVGGLSIGLGIGADVLGLVQLQVGVGVGLPLGCQEKPSSCN